MFLHRLRNLILRRNIRMGCYLSKVDDKVYITEGKGRNFQYASASCQGWRREQEDAEICLSEFDENASLFILCDGHGGAEVAKYTVAHLPDFIKNHQLYKDGKYEELLATVLVDFDAHLRTDEVMAKLERISTDDEEKTNVSENKAGPEGQTNLVGESSSAGSASEPTAGSSSAGPSTSTSNGLSSVAEDVDTETLRREAQVPIEELINKYADATTKSRILSLSKLSKEASDKEEDKSNAAGSSSASDQPEPSSSKTSADEGPSSTSSDSVRTGLDLLKKVYMEYLDDSEDDSSFEGTDDSNDDESSDDDGDDERDEETSGERSKKLLSKKHRKLTKNQSESSSEVDGEEEDDDDDDDEEDEDASASSSEGDDDDEGEEEEEEEDYEDEEEDDGGDLLNNRMLAFRKLNQRLTKAQPVKVHKPGMDSGCTVVVALAKDNKLYVASAGDSRCIMIMRDGKCQPMSFDHKPEDPIEYKRILKAGGLVCEGRVNGGLNLSRALGDFTYKDPKLDAKDQMITPCPDVKVADLDPDNVEYILLACDGIWNSYSNDSVANYVRKVAPTTKDLAEICAALFKLCLAPNCDGDGTGCDNMTCILVKYDSSNVTDSSTNNRNDLKLSSTTKNRDEDMNEVDKECEQKQSTKRQADGETEGNSDSKRRCLHLLPRSTES